MIKPFAPACTLAAALSLAVSMGSLASCSSKTTEPGEDLAGTIAIEPAEATLAVTNHAEVSQAFAVINTRPDGSTVDVTDRVTFAIDPSFGAVSEATFTTQGFRTGVTPLTATVGDKQATAQITITSNVVELGDGVPTNAPELFGNATEDAGIAPTVVYPRDGVVLPSNLGELDVHVTDDSANDLFKIDLTTQYATMTRYVTGSAQLYSVFENAAWSTVAASGADLTITVRGLRQASPSTAGTAAAITGAISQEPVSGGIYYWVTRGSSSGVGNTGDYGIFRRDWGTNGSQSEAYYTSAQTGGKCVGCHALSPDGTKLGFTKYPSGQPQENNVLDVGSRDELIQPANANDWSLMAFLPDGSGYFRNKGTVLFLHDLTAGNEGAQLETFALENSSRHFEVAPDGDRVAYVEADNGDDIHFTGTTPLVVRSFNRATLTLGARVVLVASGHNCYPSFSPDGAWILFNRSTGDCYDDKDAELWVVRADGSGQPVKLALANAGNQLSNSWPRWAPFAQTYGESGETMFWFTFSSRRDFGIRGPAMDVYDHDLGPGDPAERRLPQIWMAPFFPERIGTAQEASATAPAFRLPFQGLDTNNHIAQWTQVVVPVF